MKQKFNMDDAMAWALVGGFIVVIMLILVLTYVVVVNPHGT